MHLPTPVSEAATALVSIFWAGMLVGVSLLATPAKFQAPSLDLATALEVGKVTFALFTRVEWALAALLGISVFLGRSSWFRIACTAAAIALVAVQALWLLPVLDARIDAVIAGAPLPPTRHHMLYALTESAKLLALGAIAVPAFYRLGRSRPAEAVSG